MKEFEKAIVKEFLIYVEEVDIDLSCNIFEETIEFSGVGYFLTLRSAELPQNRIILERPDVRGILSDIEVGYVGFIENRELTLECFTFGVELLPQHREGSFVRAAT